MIAAERRSFALSRFSAMGPSKAAGSKAKRSIEARTAPRCAASAVSTAESRSVGTRRSASAAGMPIEMPRRSAASFALTMWPPECSAAGVLRECRSDSASARLPAATSRSVGTKSTESAKKSAWSSVMVTAWGRLSVVIENRRSAFRFFGRTQKRRLLFLNMGHDLGCFRGIGAADAQPLRARRRVQGPFAVKRHAGGRGTCARVSRGGWRPKRRLLHGRQR